MKNYLIPVLILALCCCKEPNPNTVLPEKAPLKTIFGNQSNEKGLVYFSFDNGNTWKNVSSGIPQNSSIGLGGVAVSKTQIGIATKDMGVFLFSEADSLWYNIPTDKIILEGNLGAIMLYHDTIYVGTQYKGVFYSTDQGKSWTSQNSGLGDTTIRRFLIFDDILYVCTNEGFYSLGSDYDSWKLEYGQPTMQVNCATDFDHELYLATSKGIFKKDSSGEWKNILPNHSVHNISSANDQIYAMTYNALLLTSKDGMVWQKAQEGLPEDLYTFNVLTQHGIALAGQWDGVYQKGKSDFHWKRSSDGLPANFAVTNLISSNGTLIVTTSKGK